MFETEILKRNEFAAYDKFIKENSGHYGQSIEIRNIIEKNFKFTPNYLITKDASGNIKAALPLFKAKSFIEGTRMVSIPFFPFGGLIYSDKEAARELLKKAKEMSLGVKFLQIRQKEFLDKDLCKDFVVQTPITNFFLDLKENEEDMMSSLHKKIRYDIRKAQSHNIKVKIGKDKKLLNDFYKVYLNTRKKRGVPAWPYGIFKDSLETLETRIAVSYYKGKAIAACFLFMDHKDIEYAFAGTDYRYNSLNPYYVLIWEIIRHGIKNKFKRLEFGGSTKEMNDGKLFNFKKRWATQTEEIPYYFYASDQNNIPLLKKSFKLYKYYGLIWSKLPKWLIRIISPPIIRQFS